MNCPECQIPIRDHPANACLDSLYAEKVMGWEKRKPDIDRDIWADYWSENNIYKCDTSDFHPSTNIAHAMQGVEKHREDIALQIRIDLSEVWCDLGERKYDVYELHTYTKGISQPINNLISLAITRALVLWAMRKG